MITLGIDSSKYQGRLDIPLLQKNKIEFVYNKGTHGLSGPVERYLENSALCAANGIKRGTYHWFLPNLDPVLQAEFYAKINDKEDDLWPAIDFEETNTIYKGRALVTRLETCVERLEQIYGREVIIYSGLWYWMQYALNEDSPYLGSKPYWHSAYPYRLGKFEYEKFRTQLEEDWPHGPEKIPTPWAKRGGATIWQADGNDGLYLPSDGVHPPVDSDFDGFRGSIDDMVVCASPRPHLLPRMDTSPPFFWAPQTSASTATEGLVPDTARTGEEKE